MKRRRGYNPKRRLAGNEALAGWDLDELASRCSYGGNPEHKRDPADYGLTPPTNPRPGKTLCDAAGAIPLGEAEYLLKGGFRKGMVSELRCGDWPRNVWSVSESGEVYEAQLENQEQGVYHGYPMPRDDEFRTIIASAWTLRSS